MVSIKQDNNLDRLLLGSWMKWGSFCVLMIQMFGEGQWRNLTVQIIVSKL